MKLTFGLLVLLAALAACSSPPPSASIRNFAEPLPGIYTSGQPTENQLAALPGLGITRVIHLRPATEKGTGWEEEHAERVGIDFVRLPVDGKNGLTRDNVELLAAELAKSRGGGTLLSCASSNRVGAMLALKARWLDGADTETAMTLGRAAGMTRLEPEVSRLLR